MKSVSEKIDRFRDHFGSHINQITEEIGNHKRELYARVLLTAMLDTFAQVAFPEEEKVGRRYARFIVDYSEWPDAKRVSLIHLGRALELDSREEFDAVRNWVEEQIRACFPLEEDPSLSHHPSEVEKLITSDPLLSEVYERWPRNENEPLRLHVNENSIDLRSLAHAGLLYQYRNHLVHEFKTPGRGVDLGRNESPFYERVSDANFVSGEMGKAGWSLDITLQRWELRYPVGFLVRMSRDCLKNLHSALQSQNRNPFSVLSEGTYWIPRLN